MGGFLEAALTPSIEYHCSDEVFYDNKNIAKNKNCKQKSNNKKLKLQYNVILGQNEGYTVKHNPLPEGVTKAEAQWKS